uniref:Uncharacterized protein n=1 Tax=Panagrolaimus sp. ES5 TaxID=591445 RepID=A0AC34F103_9BILA
MKLCYLILIFVVSCYGATLKAGIKVTDPVENEIKNLFQNITTLFHYKNPSIRGAFEEVTSCIAEEAIEEAMEGLVIKSYHGIKSNSTVQVRNKICKENKKVINSFLYCLISAQTAQFRDFLTALSLTSEFLIDEFCSSPDVTRFALFAGDDNFPQLKKKLPQDFVKPLDRMGDLQKRQMKPAGDDLCLPVRVAESVEVMAILSRKFPFYLHGAIGNLYHLTATIVFDYPFKAYKDCV